MPRRALALERQNAISAESLQDLKIEIPTLVGVRTIPQGIWDQPLGALADNTRRRRRDHSDGEVQAMSVESKGTSPADKSPVSLLEVPSVGEEHARRAVVWSQTAGRNEAAGDEDFTLRELPVGAFVDATSTKPNRDVPGYRCAH